MEMCVVVLEKSMLVTVTNCGELVGQLADER